MNFLEKEISSCKFNKEGIDKSELLKYIIESVFGELSEEQIKFIDGQVQYIIDNKLIKKKTFFGYLLKLLASVVFSK